MVCPMCAIFHPLCHIGVAVNAPFDYGRGHGKVEECAKQFLSCLKIRIIFKPE